MRTSVLPSTVRAPWGSAAHHRASRLPCRGRNWTAAAGTAPAACLSPQEAARTLVDLADRGTLATVSEDGWPLGTHASYLLDGQGQPMLRMRVDAAATKHLMMQPRCSLYVQPPVSLSRATLLGTVSRVDQEEVADVQARFAVAHRGYSGVDAVHDTDIYFKIAVDRCFYVNGLGSDASSYTVSGDDYRAAGPDPMRRLAPSLVRQFNEDRVDDVARFAEAAGVLDAVAVSMVWVDRLGFDVRAVMADGTVADVRTPFARPVEKEQDAISQLTLLAQQLWESSQQGRAYKPQPTTATAA